jgi:hypothetical protein
MTKLDVIIEGNDKTACFSFDIPAKITCPGKTSFCSSKCYADLLAKIYPNVGSKYQRNYDFSQTEQFVAYMIRNIPKNCEFRIHVSGDFYSKEYIAAWKRIVESRLDVVFYAYTRSWRTDLWEDIVALGASSNININLSLDKETGKPEVLNAESFRWCYLTDDDTAPDWLRRNDIVFRTNHNGKPGGHKWKRNRAEKKGLDPNVVAPLLHRMGKAVVCPFERGKDMPSDFSCSKCGLCVKKPKEVATC